MTVLRVEGSVVGLLNKIGAWALSAVLLYFPYG